MIKLLKTLLFSIIAGTVHISGGQCFVAQSIQDAMSFNNAAESIRVEKEEVVEQPQDLLGLPSIYKQAMLPVSPNTEPEKLSVLNFFEHDSLAIKLKQGDTFKIILPQTEESNWNIDVPENFLTMQGSQMGDKKIIYEFRAVSQGKGMFFMDNITKEDTIQSKILRFWIVKP